MQATKVKEILNQKRDMLMKESIFTGNARVNLPGNLEHNVTRQHNHLRDLGHEIIRSAPSVTKGEHQMISVKDGKTHFHTLRPHSDGKWTTLITTTSDKGFENEAHFQKSVA